MGMGTGGTGFLFAGRAAVWRLRGMHAEELRRYLSEATGRPIRLRVTDNAHSLLRATPERPGRGLNVSVHRIFLDGGPEIAAALAEFVAGPTAASRRAVRLYIAHNRERLARVADELEPAGRVFDLAPRAASINQTCFGGKLEYRIGWSNPPRARRRQRHVTLGQWDVGRRAILIHPMLDSPLVPGFYLDGVIHHEMVHIVVPSSVGCTGRMTHHSPEFRLMERAYPWFVAAQQWEKANLGRIIDAWCLGRGGRPAVPPPCGQTDLLDPC